MKPETFPSPNQPTANAPELSVPLRSANRMILVESIDSTAVLKMNTKQIENTPEAALRLLTELRDTLEHLAPRPDRVVLSLEAVQYLGLSGIGVILQIHQGAQPQHGRFPPLAIADLQAQPREKLRVTKLDTVIPTFTSAADALADTSWPKAA